MWTTKNRARYERKGLRFESDLTDEYALIEPFLPPDRNVSRRSLINGTLYVLTRGCQWRQLPKDFPPKSTTHDYYVELQCAGAHSEDRRCAHKNSSCAACRSAGVGGQAHNADTGDCRQPNREERRKRGPKIDSAGYDAGKKIKGIALGKARERRIRDESVKPLKEVQLVKVQPGQSRSGQAGSECCLSPGDWRVRSVHSKEAGREGSAPTSDMIATPTPSV